MPQLLRASGYRVYWFITKRVDRGMDWNIVGVPAGRTEWAPDGLTEVDEHEFLPSRVPLIGEWPIRQSETI